MMLAKAGKYNGFLLKGIAGVGTLLPVGQAAKVIAYSQKNAPKKNSLASEFSQMAEPLNE